MARNLAKLKKVELRDIWAHEASDFTNWLAQKENLDALSEEIGVGLKLIKTEANVGKFSVDILAEEETSNRKIIIENQLENTNHDHLGKIITYASGYDAEIIIWIVKDVRDEHQKAIEWLNEHTDENINFFLIKIELWQIENSNPAPKFEIIVSPNEWAKTIKANPNNEELTNIKLQQLEFWNKFKNYVQEIDKKIRLRTPRPQHWYDISIGNSDGHITLTINTRDNLLDCGIYINNNKGLYNFLFEQRDEIESEVGEKLEWRDLAIASRIQLKKSFPNVLNFSEAEKYFSWLYEKTILFQKVFIKYFKEFKK